MQRLHLLLQELREVLLAAVVLLDQPRLQQREDPVQLIGTLSIAPQKLLPDVSIVGLEFLQQFSIPIQPGEFCGESLPGDKEILVLLGEPMAGVVDDALDADVSIIGFAVELIGFIVDGAELVVLSDFFLLACELQHYKIFGEHVGFDLRVVLVAAGGAVQEFFFLVDDGEALFADRVAAV